MGKPRKQPRHQQKQCASCKCWKQLNAFTINRHSSDGHDSYCRECAQIFRQKHWKHLRAYHRNWREQHRERLRQQAREHYQQNLEHKHEINRRWRERNPDKVRITNQRSAQKQRDTLSDSYILHLLTKRSGLSRKNIPAELIEAKRQELERERVARKMLSELRSMIYETSQTTT